MFNKLSLLRTVRRSEKMVHVDISTIPPNEQPPLIKVQANGQTLHEFYEVRATFNPSDSFLSLPPQTIYTPVFTPLQDTSISCDIMVYDPSTQQSQTLSETYEYFLTVLAMGYNLFTNTFPLNLKLAETRWECIENGIVGCRVDENYFYVDYIEKIGMCVPVTIPALPASITTSLIHGGWDFVETSTDTIMTIGDGYVDGFLGPLEARYIGYLPDTGCFPTKYPWSMDPVSINTGLDTSYKIGNIGYGVEPFVETDQPITGYTKTITNISNLADQLEDNEKEYKHSQYKVFYDNNLVYHKTFHYLEQTVIVDKLSGFEDGQRLFSAQDIGTKHKMRFVVENAFPLRN